MSDSQNEPELNLQKVTSLDGPQAGVSGAPANAAPKDLFAGSRVESANRSAYGGRRKVLVNSKFQLAFLSYTLGVTLLTIAIFYISDLYFFWKFKDGGRVLGLNPEHPYFKFIVEQEKVRTWIFMAAAGISAAFLTISGLLFSHRIAGPLHRLKSHFLMVANDLTIEDVRFRKDDFFHDVAESYNILMAKFRKHRIEEVLKSNGEKTTEEPDQKKAA
jgi:hypothetical protein